MEDLNPSQEIQVYLDKIDREQSYIDDRCYEIERTVNFLECEQGRLTLSLMVIWKKSKVICQRALTGEPVAIWAELQRFGFYNCEEHARKQVLMFQNNWELCHINYILK